MPMITLSDTTDAKLKLLVTDPFEDTRVSIVEGLIDAELERRGVTANSSGRNGALRATPERLNPDRPINLAHTRVLSATVDGRPIHRPKWNSVMNYLHILARQRLGSFDLVRKASAAALREGRFEEYGYKYLPEADLSISGVDANHAWDYSLRLARALDVPLEVTLEWRNKDGAARPGERAVLGWSPIRT